jgi:hippurate hydrolase
MERFGIQEIYGMHNWPGRPAGSFAIRSGPFFAAADTFEIVVRGKGGHAAKPQIAVDSTLAASHVVVALQSIASRNVDPVEQVVVSVCSFETSSKAHNVIPAFVTLRGTVRTLDAGIRDLAERRLGEIARLTAQAYGAEAEVRYERGYPVMINHDEPTEFAAEVAREVSGDCAESPLVMGGEDFAYMLESRPGAYILIRNGDTAPVHHPAYDFSDDAIPAGVSWWAGVVERRMPAA